MRLPRICLAAALAASPLLAGPALATGSAIQQLRSTEGLRVAPGVAYVHGTRARGAYSYYLGHRRHLRRRTLFPRR